MVASMLFGVICLLVGLFFSTDAISVFCIVVYVDGNHLFYSCYSFCCLHMSFLLCSHSLIWRTTYMVFLLLLLMIVILLIYIVLLYVTVCLNNVSLIGIGYFSCVPLGYLAILLLLYYLLIWSINASLVCFLFISIFLIVLIPRGGGGVLCQWLFFVLCIISIFWKFLLHYFVITTSWSIPVIVNDNLCYAMNTTVFSSQPSFTCI